ncbi:MAG: class I SAM-dependent methyltransferase [Saprospiraceae bacterium]
MSTIVNQCPSCQGHQFKELIQTKVQMQSSDDRFNFQQCENCALVFLNPRVAPEALKEYYTGAYLPYRGAKAWGKYESFVDSSQKKLDKKRADFVSQYTTINKDSVVLDVGCGNPTFLETCSNQYNCKTIGLDFSDEGWKNAKERFSAIDLRTGEVDTLTKELQPDLITMWHYLEHDYDPLKTLKHLKSIAHEKTILVIEVPNYDSDSRKKYGANWAGFHTPRHTFLFSPDNLSLLLKQAGWKPKAVNTYGTLDPYNLYWMSEMEKKNTDWNKSMEAEFVGYVKGMISFLPKRFNAKKRSLGIMTGIAGL